MKQYWRAMKDCRGNSAYPVYEPAKKVSFSKETGQFRPMVTTL